MQTETEFNTAVRSLGACVYPSPLKSNKFISDSERLVINSKLGYLKKALQKGKEPLAVEYAGPRKDLFFQAGLTKAGIVTCGGLCPGLNDVIRSIVMALHYNYGCKEIYGFRNGYQGITYKASEKPYKLKPQDVLNIHNDGGTVLGSSRGAPDMEQIIDYLADNDINILFTIGGDGTQRGAHAIYKAACEKGHKLSVVGLPKTIDNDIAFTSKSFGFLTACEEARHSITSAFNEARGAYGGIGIVKLMGRDSGFIAANAVLANNSAKFCLIPEEDFDLEGKNGLLNAIHKRINAGKSTVIVVAEGAGQHFFKGGQVHKDASGNVLHNDIGLFLKDKIKTYLKENNLPASVKYIDPSYIIRSQPANAEDSAFCLLLGQHAVHAAMAGKTDIVIGSWDNQFVHIPIEMAVHKRKKIDTSGHFWESVRFATGQPLIKNS
ncbi:MAG TPA: ATP-dependent 6-phosphofructokinase [Spirochaetota bacterium]|nr:ATP-dependent 6-phosphofructokinase [Spirochaetota bacterium]